MLYAVKSASQFNLHYTFVDPSSSLLNALNILSMNIIITIIQIKMINMIVVIIIIIINIKMINMIVVIIIIIINNHKSDECDCYAYDNNNNKW